MLQSLRVFVVDDEPVIAQTLSTILRNDGFEVDAFTVPAEALMAARSLHPNLLISDVMMPALTGVELAIQFSSVVPNCEILLISGQTSTVDLLKGARAAGHDFRLLQKPIHPTHLLEVIRSVVC